MRTQRGERHDPGELLMLSFDVSERMISRCMKRAPRDPEPATRWLTFLRNHREVIAAMDFFTVPVWSGNQAKPTETTSSL